MKKKLVVVGAGISGISISKMLHNYFDVTVLEKNNQIGGLIKCDRIDDVLFHRVGGHVFNSNNIEVLNWFWANFKKDEEFLLAKRNAKILLNNKLIDYPIENHLYQLEEETIRLIVYELFELSQRIDKPVTSPDFENFLKLSFGNTLYDIYFGPYNKKIWNYDLNKIPINWLKDKLPMPNVLETIVNNILKKEDVKMVHSTFFYPINGGSQFIINRLAEGLNIKCGLEVNNIEIINDKIFLNNRLHPTDYLVYCGDVRVLHDIIKTNDINLTNELFLLKNLPSNGTSNFLCETDETDISWLYLPEKQYKAHRIIYTGNFSKNNNKKNGKNTCVVEFSGIYDRATMLKEINKLPGNLKPIEMNYEKNSYIIHQENTRNCINNVKLLLEKYNIFLLGRFAEWEYFNMDKCIEGALSLSYKLKSIRS
jgi:protoporphyrinogen oxidase